MTAIFLPAGHLEPESPGSFGQICSPGHEPISRDRAIHLVDHTAWLPSSITTVVYKTSLCRREKLSSFCYGIH